MAATAPTSSIAGISLAPEASHEATGAGRSTLGSPSAQVSASTVAIYEGPTGPRVSLRMGDHWFREVDLAQAKNIIVSFNAVIQRKTEPFAPRRLEWPLVHWLFQPTGSDLAPAFNKLDEETAHFVDERGLTDAVAWLRTATPHFFSGADFEVDLLPAEEGEDNLLGLRVFGAFDSSEFRERRHGLCKAMLAAGHRTLYDVISVFQRRVTDGGWQAFSWYCSVSTE